MNTQTRSESSVQTKKSKSRFVFCIVALLLVLAAGVFLASSVRVVSISGTGESYVLEASQIRLGILIIEEDATAIFREKSHWIGPVISKEGALTVEDDVTITGPVILFSDSLRLGENATVQGSVYLFAGGLTLEPGASVRHNAVLFASGLTLEQRASIRGDVISFAGPVVLQGKASLRGDAVLFAGNMQIGREAAAYGKLISFFGGLELAPKAVLRDDAVLFFGDVHLYPEALVRGDVIVTEGDATLEGQSAIYGKLYLNPESDTGRGRLYQSSEAQITRGVVESENIESVAGWRVGGWVLGHMLRFTLLPVVVVCILMALMFYLGRRTSALKHKNGAKARYAESSPQPTISDLG